MDTDKPSAPKPAEAPTPKEAEVTPPEPLEFAPPGEVEWTSEEKHPEEWRPAESPQTPPRVGAGDEWQPPGREPAPQPGDDKTRE